MTAPLRETYANRATTTLTSSANTTTTSLSLTDASTFPSTGNFRIKVDDELMLATARSSNTLTVTRNVEGTSSASHSGGATVSQVLTAGALQRFGRDAITNYSGTAPPQGIYDSTGAVITASSFTLNNPGSATLTDFDGGLAIRDPSRTSGENVRFAWLSAPSTPYTMIVGLYGAWLSSSAIGLFGVGFRNSSTSKISAASWDYRSDGPDALAVYQWTDSQHVDSAVFPRNTIYMPGAIKWLKVTDDGTNTVYSVSPDGVNFIQAFSEARGTFFSGGNTANQVGFLTNNYSTSFDLLTVVRSLSFA